MPNWAIRLEGKADMLIEGQRRIEIAVDGTPENPHAGLKLRVLALENERTQRDKELSKAEKTRNWWTGIAVSMGGLAFGAWIKAKLEGH